MEAPRHKERNYSKKQRAIGGYRALTAHVTILFFIIIIFRKIYIFLSKATYISDYPDSSSSFSLKIPTEVEFNFAVNNFIKRSLVTNVSGEFDRLHIYLLHEVNENLIPIALKLDRRCSCSSL